MFIRIKEIILNLISKFFNFLDFIYDLSYFEIAEFLVNTYESLKIFLIKKYKDLKIFLKKVKKLKKMKIKNFIISLLYIFIFFVFFNFFFHYLYLIEQYFLRIDNYLNKYQYFEIIQKKKIPFLFFFEYTKKINTYHKISHYTEYLLIENKKIQIITFFEFFLKNIINLKNYYIQFIIDINYKIFIISKYFFFFFIQPFSFILSKNLLESLSKMFNEDILFYIQFKKLNLDNIINSYEKNLTIISKIKIYVYIFFFSLFKNNLETFIELFNKIIEIKSVNFDFYFFFKFIFFFLILAHTLKNLNTILLDYFNINLKFQKLSYFLNFYIYFLIYFLIFPI